MEQRRTSVRRAGLATMAIVLVLGASACSGGVVGPAPAATVNGVEITQADLTQMVTDYHEFWLNEGPAEQAQLAQETAAGQATDTPEGLQARIDQALATHEQSGYTYPTEGAASQLTELIRLEVFEQALADAGGKVTDAQKEQAEASLKEGYPSFDDAPEFLRQLYIDTDATRLALIETAPQELRDGVDGASAEYEAQLQQIYQENPDAFLQVCGRVLGTADQASADAALARINDGQDFSTVASEVTILDPTGATQTQCYSATDILQAFGEAAVDPAKGDLYGPSDLTSAEGPLFLALVVDAVQPEPFESARETIAAQIPDEFTPKAEQALYEYLTDLIGKAADVTVDPRFGTWNPDTVSVEPPEVPVEPTTPPDTTTTTAVLTELTGS